MRVHAARLAAVALAILLSACDSVMYTSPTGGPTAKLRVVAANSEGYFAWTRDVTDTCSRDSPNLPLIGGDAKPDTENQGMPGSTGAKGDRFERLVRADRTIALTASSMRRGEYWEYIAMATYVGEELMRMKNWTCEIRIEFAPQPGASYEMLYDFAPGKCDIRVSELAMSSGVVARQPVTIRTRPATCGTATKGA